MLFPGLGRGGDVVVGRRVRDPRGEASGESEVFRDHLSEASEGAERWASSFSYLAGGPTRESFSLSFFC
jgi:hypothetical protein